MESERMKRTATIVIGTVTIVVSVYLLAAASGLIYRPAWLRKSRNRDFVTHSEIKGIANGLEHAGVIPPETGFSEYGQSNGQQAVRLQYLDGKPTVIGTGKDYEFGTDDDIICSYKEK